MIEWIEKLPDSASGVVLAGTLWLGLNYAVLAERAMAKDVEQKLIPSCMATLDAQSASPEMTQLNQILDNSPLGKLADMFGGIPRPLVLTKAQKLAQCECAVLQTREVEKLDYAIHTASFRILTPKGVAAFRSTAAEFVLPSKCKLAASVGGQL